MSWIKVIERADADEVLNKAYNEVAAARGHVANILKVHSLHPETLTAHFTLYKQLMFGRSELSRTEREIIAVAVSVTNNCHY